MADIIGGFLSGLGGGVVTFGIILVVGLITVSIVVGAIVIYFNWKKYN